MRSRAELVGVIDFGSRVIRVLIARKDHDGTVQILGHGTAPGRGCVSQGVIQDLNAAQMALKRALAMAEKEARVRVDSLFCGVNGRNVETFIRESNVKVEREIVEQAHMDEARDIASRDILAPGKRVTSSFTAQEWYVDDLRVIDPIGIRGQVLKIRIHFARLPAVIEDNVLTCIESQGRELEDIIFLPLASALGCLTPEDMELGVAVLDIGRSTTGLAVYRDYRILGTHCFEWGGYHLTRDIAAGLQVSFEEADELILEYGISVARIRSESEPEAEDASFPSVPEERAARIKLKSAVHGAAVIVERQQLDMIMYERARELLTKVRQHVHARGLSKNLVRGVVLTGGAGAIKNHSALAESVFQVPCRVGYPNSVEILPQAVNAPEFSAAVGIVRHAFEYRAAARNGRVEPRGPVVSGMRRLGRFVKKYFI
ncbi:MAG: cell division protein FtsA [Candidatus Hydrogenedentes bacterium]|nr:cell division protein FtsA [Candidatus Hydrogenedentota bacterium]